MMRSRIGVLAALLVGAGACGGTKPCKEGTLLVTVTFEGAASNADHLEVQVTVAGATKSNPPLTHTAGKSTGTIEVEFPQHYPEGQPVDVTVTALQGGVETSKGTGAIASLPKGCGTLHISVRSDTDGGAGTSGGGSGGAGGTAGTGGTGGSIGGTGGVSGGPSGGTGGPTGTGGTGGTGDGGTVLPGCVLDYSNIDQCLLQ